MTKSSFSQIRLLNRHAPCCGYVFPDSSHLRSTVRSHCFPGLLGSCLAFAVLLSAARTVSHGCFLHINVLHPLCEKKWMQQVWAVPTLCIPREASFSPRYGTVPHLQTLNSPQDQTPGNVLIECFCKPEALSHTVLVCSVYVDVIDGEYLPSSRALELQ